MKDNGIAQGKDKTTDESMLKSLAFDNTISTYRWLCDTLDHYIDRRLHQQSLLLSISALSSIIAVALDASSVKYQLPIFIILFAAILSAVYFVRSVRYLPFTTLPVITGHGEGAANLKEQLANEVYGKKYQKMYDNFTESGKYYRWSLSLSLSYIATFYAHISILTYTDIRSYCSSSVAVLAGLVVAGLINYWYQKNNTSHKGQI
jgi:hypothetical protein